MYRLDPCVLCVEHVLYSGYPCLLSRSPLAGSNPAGQSTLGVFVSPNDWKRLLLPLGGRILLVSIANMRFV